jgi:two-component system sensor histidine kinase VicK
MVNNVLHMQQQRLASMHEGQRIDLRSIAEQCIERAQILADRDAIWRQQPHEIRLNGPKMAYEVWGEPVQLSYVFDNLLSNAVKFSPNGGLVKLNIWTELFKFPPRDLDSTLPDSMCMPQPAILVAVEDHGIGIAPEEVENIWLEFYQADLTETRQFGGTGIGLALVKEIVEQFGGKVWLESTSTQGSTFMFALPAYQEFQPTAIEQLVPPTETKILQQS